MITEDGASRGEAGGGAAATGFRTTSRWPFRSTDQIRCVEIPERLVAASTLHGAYDGVYGASDALSAWVTSNDVVVTGPMFNIYTVGPGSNPDPAAWVTEICVPIEKA